MKIIRDIIEIITILNYNYIKTLNIKYQMMNSILMPTKLMIAMKLLAFIFISYMENFSTPSIS